MLGCIIAVIINCILGIIWYSEKLPMGRRWMKRTYPGKSAADVDKENSFAMAFSVISTIFLSLLLRFLLIDFFKSITVLDAVKFGVGLTCLTTLLESPHVLFAKGYLDVFAIGQVYNLLSVVASCASIVYFR